MRKRSLAGLFRAVVGVLTAFQYPPDLYVLEHVTDGN